MNEPAQSFRFVVSSGTDVGRVRSLNEDAFLDRSEIGLWVVADGMGGHAAGDFASRTIVEALERIAPPSDGSAFLREVEDRIQIAHAALRRESEARGSGGIIGSTVVVLIAWNRHYACVWAGDSRLYLLRDGVLRQVSRDHSLVQDLVEAGELAPEQAESHPQANVVTRAVGAVEDLVLDKTHQQIAAGDIFLLCSDGLTRHVSDQEIAAVLAGEAAPDAAQVLIDLALDRGAKDNVTAVVVRCELEDGGSSGPGGDPNGPGSGPGAEPLPEAWDEDPETTLPVGAPFRATDPGPAASVGAPGTAPEDPLASILADGPADRASGAGADTGSEPVPVAPDDLGLEPMPAALDPAPPVAPVAAPREAPEDPLASILADGPADRAPGAGAARMADDLGRGRDRDPLDLAGDAESLPAAGPPAERPAGPNSRRGVRIGLLLGAAGVALAAAYILYSVLTLP